MMSQHYSGQIDHAGVFTCAYSLSFVNPASASVKLGVMVGLVLSFRKIQLLGNLSFFVFCFPFFFSFNWRYVIVSVKSISKVRNSLRTTRLRSVHAEALSICIVI